MRSIDFATSTVIVVSAVVGWLTFTTSTTSSTSSALSNVVSIKLVSAVSLGSSPGICSVDGIGSSSGSRHGIGSSGGGIIGSSGNSRHSLRGLVSGLS